MIIAGVSRYGMFLYIFNHFSHSILLSSAILSLQFCLRHISRFQNVEHLPGLPPATDPMAARSVGWLNFIKDIVTYHGSNACVSMMSSLLPMNRKTHEWNKMCRELHWNSGPGQWITSSKLLLYLLYCLLDTLNLRHCNHYTCIF